MALWLFWLVYALSSGFPAACPPPPFRNLDKKSPSQGTPLFPPTYRFTLSFLDCMHNWDCFVLFPFNVRYSTVLGRYLRALKGPLILRLPLLYSPTSCSSYARTHFCSRVSSPAHPVCPCPRVCLRSVSFPTHPRDLDSLQQGSQMYQEYSNRLAASNVGHGRKVHHLRGSRCLTWHAVELLIRRQSRSIAEAG